MRIRKRSRRSDNNVRIYNKHTIDGVVKRNKDWFIHFSIKPKTGNGKLCGKQCNKDMKKVLEFFGVDTSGMLITPYI